jgi:hypothetical protein
MTMSREYNRWYLRSDLPGAVHHRDLVRRSNAIRRGHVPPPPEAECPPRPADGLCQYCRQPPARFVMDHNHRTGAFLAWCCTPCNNRITDKIGPLGELPPVGKRQMQRRAKAARGSIARAPIKRMCGPR